MFAQSNYLSCRIIIANAIGHFQWNIQCFCICSAQLLCSFHWYYVCYFVSPFSNPHRYVMPNNWTEKMTDQTQRQIRHSFEMTKQTALTSAISYESNVDLADSCFACDHNNRPAQRKKKAEFTTKCQPKTDTQSAPINSWTAGQNINRKIAFMRLIPSTDESKYTFDEYGLFSSIAMRFRSCELSILLVHWKASCIIAAVSGCQHGV